MKMNTCVVFLALAIAVHCGIVPQEEDIPHEEDGANMKYFLVERTAGVYEIEDLVNAPLDTRASASDLAYHFFSKSSPTRGTTLKSTNVAALSQTAFTSSKGSVFVIHGWLDHNESTFNIQMRETLLAKHDVNVFIVDWEPIASKNYLSAKGSVVEVGNILASFIRSLVSSYGLQLSKTALVGHSLGAHIAGNAGAALGRQVDHIVGLDPAGPLFSSGNINERLDPTDAKFVHVIHTNGGLLGYSGSSGHADYYPNGGSSQPGCGLDITGGCAHARSFAYYSESITSSSNLFSSNQCTSYSNYQNGRCNNNRASLLGGYTVDNGASGNYYLTTRSSVPYARG